ncbi:hypothetical protein L204_103485 [Cryptococcus depauperatus]
MARTERAGLVGANHYPMSANGSRVGHDAASGKAGHAVPKQNPLADLIDSEVVYVAHLEFIVSGAAGAWSKYNLPPPRLDAMFRCVKAIQGINKLFVQKLQSIGPAPSNPNTLGDLLMRWVGDLDPVYHRYCISYFTHFDSNAHVSKNKILSARINEYSKSCPPSPPSIQWTLDELFLLPYRRLKYYKKMYMRLLKNSKEGQNVYDLLTNANQRLDSLLREIEARLGMDVNDQEEEQIYGNKLASSENYVMAIGNGYSQDRRTREVGVSVPTNPSPQIPHIAENNLAVSQKQSFLYDLEYRIDTERTVDLFTMQPKQCKLQINPENLSFTRFLRSSHDVTLQFTPSATRQQIVSKRAHIVILSDLLIITEWMTANDRAAKIEQIAREQPERARKNEQMPELWLKFPPLTGKHLVVKGEQDKVAIVTVLRKELFNVHASSKESRDQIIKDLNECAQFVSSGGSSTDTQVSTMPLVMSHLSLSTSRPPRVPSADRNIAGHTSQASLVSRMTLQSDEVNQPLSDSRSPDASQHVSTSMSTLPPRGTSLNNLQPSSQPVARWSNSPDMEEPQRQMKPTSSGESYALGGPLDSFSSQGLSPDWDSRNPRHEAPNPSGAQILPRMSNNPYPPTLTRWPEEASTLVNDHSWDTKSTGGSVHRDLSSPLPDQEQEAKIGPAVITASMKCKVFLKQSHQQWKPLGAGKLTLYSETGSNAKQLVVQSGSSGKQVLLSTVLSTDGVERVAKTGIAIEVSDRGRRTGVVYMIQLGNEKSAAGLFHTLLVGSDRAL